MSESDSADLPKHVKEEAEERSAPAAVVVHEAIVLEGRDELARKGSTLFWSGLAAGLSMGFSLITEGLLRAHLADTGWRPLVARLGYSVGFLIVVLGRQQLFTENTLTVILPLLRRKATILNVLRLWGIVLVANLIGAWLVAWAIAKTSVFEPHIQQAFSDLATEAAAAGFGTVLLRGIFAGWLIALMVWLMPGAESARVLIIIIITYVIAIGGFAHVIAGSVDKLYLVWMGKLSGFGYLSGFLLPSLVGNIIGGISLVAALNHGAAGREPAEA